MKTKYRVVKDRFAGYEIQYSKDGVKWKQYDGCNTFPSKEKAIEYAESIDIPVWQSDQKEVKEIKETKDNDKSINVPNLVWTFIVYWVAWAIGHYLR